MLALLLVAVSLGLSNFAASVGLGASGVDRRTRLRVGLVFGFFETAMPIIGLLAGRGAAGVLGHATRWLGGALLIATGIYSLIQALRPARDGAQNEPQPLGRLLITGLALSVDNLAVGFALGTVPVSLPVAAIVIGAVSVALSLLGLELGHRLTVHVGDRGEILGGVVLIGVGIAVGAGVL
jgi:putative Mn2+ efflux pump MntP